MEKKKCPMSFNAVISTVRAPKEEDFNCIKEKCEWWIASESCCSLRMIAMALIHISNHSKFSEVK